MEWISYRIKTLSSLIVSPRSALAFYNELEEFHLESDPEYLSGEIKVIYPFYQYGNILHTSLKTASIISQAPP